VRGKRKKGSPDRRRGEQQLLDGKEPLHGHCSGQQEEEARKREKSFFRGKKGGEGRGVSRQRGKGVHVS